MRYFILAGLLSVSVFLVTPVFAANGLVPCDGVDCSSCHLVTLADNILKFLISVSVIIAAVMFVIGGLTMVMSAGDTGKVDKGREMMSNAIIGIVIVLAAWLVVDTVLKMVLSDTAYGMWNKIQCTTQTAATPPPSQPGSVTGGVGTTPITGGGAQCADGNTACSVDALISAGFSDTQANVMSCLAMTESSGDPNARNNTSNSTACGTFQILRSTWDDVPRSSGCDSFFACTDATCNMQVAKQLVARSGYSSWTCPGCNSKAQECVNKYGG